MPPGYGAVDLWVLLPEIVVSVGAAIVLCLVFRHRERDSDARARTAVGVALASVALAAIALLVQDGAYGLAAGGVMVADEFRRFMGLLFLAAAGLTLLMSERYIVVEGVPAVEYCGLVLCATLGMLVLAGAVDLVTIFIGLETVAVPFYVLAGVVRPNRRSNEAAMKYFVLGAFSLAVLLYGFSFLYGVAGSTRLGAIAAAATEPGAGTLVRIGLAFVLAGMAFKIAAVPFHMWAPDVYEGAPTPVTAFLSVGSKTAAFAMLIRVLVVGLPAFAGTGLGTLLGRALGWRDWLAVLAILSMTVGNLAALRQTNTKRLLAYSSIAQAGYALIGLAAGTTRGMTATLLYLAVYAAMQMGALAIVTAMRRGDRAGDEIEDLRGLARRHPSMGAALLLFMLSLGGLPPTAGFMGKLWIFGAAIDAGQAWLAVVGVLNSALSLYYYLRVAAAAWMPGDAGDAPSPIRSRSLAVAVGLAAAVTLGAGLFPQPLFTRATRAAAALTAGPPGPVNARR